MNARECAGGGIHSGQGPAGNRCVVSEVSGPGGGTSDTTVLKLHRLILRQGWGRIREGRSWRGCCDRCAAGRNLYAGHDQHRPDPHTDFEVFRRRSNSPHFTSGVAPTICGLRIRWVPGGTSVNGDTKITINGNSHLRFSSRNPQVAGVPPFRFDSGCSSRPNRAR